jgi:hypothetical protein
VRPKGLGKLEKLIHVATVLIEIYFSPIVNRMIKSMTIGWARKLAHMEEMCNAYRKLLRKPEGKGPKGISRCRLEDNKIDK